MIKKEYILWIAIGWIIILYIVISYKGSLLIRDNYTEVGVLYTKDCPKCDGKIEGYKEYVNDKKDSGYCIECDYNYDY